MAKRTAETRVEHDSLGEMAVPAEAFYGAQTARAVANFPISGWRMPGSFVAALAGIKAAFARAHGELGLLPPELAEAIAATAEEVAAGGHADQFPVDVFQTGSGTSSNMNMNEVVAHLANRRLGGDPAAHRPIHPNDHVNLGQSSNDAVPAAIRIAAALLWVRRLRPTADAVSAEFRRLGDAHHATVTLGRTHLMDAVPTTYGRVFDGWARRLDEAIARCDNVATGLVLLPLGGTAVGTGIGSQAHAVQRAAEILRERTGVALELMANPAVGIAAQETPIAFADALAGLGRTLLAVANDIRLRASGPFGGLGERRLPAVQPGSSIMPGKVNPVIPEAVAQVAIQVEGLAAACRATATLHQLDLSHGNPLLAWNLDTMATLLTGACRTLVAGCLRGLDVDVVRARRLAAVSPALATALAARIGYDRAAEVAKAAEGAGETVLEAARRLGVLPAEELDQLLDLDRLAGAKP
ncbi:MAG: lyase family protein [Acidobacteriota bacterium]